MNQIKPSNYIRLQRKICKADLIITVNQLASEWGLTPEETCYRILCESLVKEGNKRKDK